jgi:hypothetical protein
LVKYITMKIVITERYQNFRLGDILKCIDTTKKFYICMRNHSSVLIPMEYAKIISKIDNVEINTKI